MTEPPPAGSPQVRLTPSDVATMRRHLEAALDGLDALDHLCEIQQHVARVEEGISAALYVLGGAAPAAPPAESSDTQGSEDR